MNISNRVSEFHDDGICRAFDDIVTAFIIYTLVSWFAASFLGKFIILINETLLELGLVLEGLTCGGLMLTVYLIIKILKNKRRSL